jgi:hypothetical protein
MPLIEAELAEGDSSDDFSKCFQKELPPPLPGWESRGGSWGPGQNGSIASAESSRLVSRSLTRGCIPGRIRGAIPRRCTKTSVRRPPRASPEVRPTDHRRSC